MADYGKLLSRIWSDPEFTALDARAQQLYCLLISYHSRNLAGVLPLTLKRWAGSTRDATVDNITEALQQLAKAGFIVVDWDTEEVLIRTYVRNDEVHRQPNLMKAARKFALQIESPALRRALSAELMRLPEHKDAAETERVAKQLVETLTEPFAEPLPEPFAEPISEPPGVGVSYVSREREHQHQHQTPAPAAAPRPVAVAPRPHVPTLNEIVGASKPPPPPPDPGPSAIPARELVKRIIPTSHPADIRGKLAHQATRLLQDGVSPELVEAGLQLWLTKPHAGPALLPSLVSEVIKTNTPQTTGPAPMGRASTKAQGYLDAGARLAARMRAAEHHNDQPGIEA